ncbi:hypothetical protein PQO01_20425 [Lentisphaera marina]|uniref:hypothetical protein n=1 Tax=Lentisphaera marina TaxID=1111041 RepID=UPI002365B6CC|nr:hypothetical protein [Lentisphaera marina]MDD7987326.1 hypothetical protein [Lentisphaera marina]
MSRHIPRLIILSIVFQFTFVMAAENPLEADICKRLEHDVQYKKSGFLAGNLSYYVGGHHPSWKADIPKFQETIGLTHPFYHDLRSRGFGLAKSKEQGPQNTGIGNDYWGWEFYKNTRVLYGSVIIDGTIHKYPVPTKMLWRPDKMICEYEVAGVKIKEEKFIAANDAACSIITSSKPVTLVFDGQSFWGEKSLKSTATINYDSSHNAIVIKEGGITETRPQEFGGHTTAPIMYQDMSTVLTASKNFAQNLKFSKGKKGQEVYEFSIPCDSKGVSVVWSMHDDRNLAFKNARHLLSNAKQELAAKSKEMNYQLTQEIPWFRCSDKRIEDIYYYLWSMQLMYYIDVQKGWEMENHTQTAVNNFLGIHRYDSMFQIKVGAWAADKERLAYGNVLTWKHLFVNKQYKKSRNGHIALADNKGTTWHSGAYGHETSEHVIGAWQIYEHSNDLNFLRNCYEGYFREMFWEGIPQFFMNEFEVREILAKMAKLTGNEKDMDHWLKNAAGKDILTADNIQKRFASQWENHGHKNFFMAPGDGMLMTTGFWPMRLKHFPREYAVKMVNDWAINSDYGFYGKMFPLAMSKYAMKKFATSVDHTFGYTPDTAYFTLIGMFTKHLGDPAWQLTLNHLLNYNYHKEWDCPVAPEAYDRDAKPFGDQYSNFNAGKILLILEGLAGIKYSLPDNTLTITDTMPKAWGMMEVGIPIRAGKDKKTQWVKISYKRERNGPHGQKTISVSNSPLKVNINPWLEGGKLAKKAQLSPQGSKASTSPPAHAAFTFPAGEKATLKIQIAD